MQDEIRALLDKDEIRDLRIRYSHLLDGNRIDALDRVFAADAVVEVTVGRMEGLEAIKAGLKDAYTLFDRNGRGHYPFMHPIANHLIELTGPDSATGSCYLIDFETASKSDPNPLLLLGLYADEYRRIDGAWRITQTRLDVVWPTSEAPPESNSQA
ncbi:SnoaL-like protein [Novosphingobium sp. PhB165]|nr:SnoaL-like protein [Novosphingobium sp. PhB165]